MQVPDKYQFIRAKDIQKNGRFDVTLYKTKKDMDNEANGTLVHSKKDHLDFPDDKADSDFTSKCIQFVS